MMTDISSTELSQEEAIDFEEQLATKLRAEKYATKEWNFMR